MNEKVFLSVGRKYCLKLVTLWSVSNSSLFWGNIWNFFKLYGIFIAIKRRSYISDIWKFIARYLSNFIEETYLCDSYDTICNPTHSLITLHRAIYFYCQYSFRLGNLDGIQSKMLPDIFSFISYQQFDLFPKDNK
jgi:hypothetical protein